MKFRQKMIEVQKKHLPTLGREINKNDLYSVAIVLSVIGSSLFLKYSIGKSKRLNVIEKKGIGYSNNYIVFDDGTELGSIYENFYKRKFHEMKLDSFKVINIREDKHNNRDTIEIFSMFKTE